MSRQLPGGEESGSTGIWRKISVEMHNDARYLALTPVQPSGRALWHHLLFGPHTTSLPGLAKIGRAAMAEELGWSLEAFDEAFREVEAQGMAVADWHARVVWLPNAIRHNLPSSPNVVKSWRRYWNSIPDCELKRLASSSFRSALSGAYLLAFDDIIGPQVHDGVQQTSSVGEPCVEVKDPSEAKPCEKVQPEASGKASGKPSAEPSPNQKAESREQKDTLSLRSSDVRAAAPGKALGPDWPTDYREQFWQRYPEKVAKPKALAKLDALARGGKAKFGEIMAGLDRYIAGKPADRQWCNPLTWLNGERWADQPAVAAGQPSRHGSVAEQSPTRRRTFTDEEWREAVRAYQASGDYNWNHITYDSTEPRAAGCKVPRPILVEFGYRPAEAQAA